MVDLKQNSIMFVYCSNPETRNEGDCACAGKNDVLSVAQFHTNELDRDCAFPDLTMPTLTGAWHVAPNAQAFPLPGDWRGLFVPSGVVPLAVLNDPAYELWSRFRERQELAALGLDEEETRALREMASVGLLRPQPSLKPQIRASQSAILASWLHLTDRCNLDCAYCYLPHKPEDMSPSTGRAAIDATFRSVLKHGYQKVKFKYTGGEPLLRFPLLLELHRYAQELAEEHEIVLDGVVLSNGTLLTEEMVAQLQTLGLRLMISLDGVGEWHDVQRPYLGGRGSFKDVEEGVELALAGGLIPDISITVSGRNAEGLPEVIAWVLERDLPFSINFYRQNDHAIVNEDLALEEEKIIAGMLAAFEVVENNLPEHSLLTSLADRANLAVPHRRTCSVGESYLVFDQHGRVAKCQMQMDQPITDISAEDPLTLVQEDQFGIQNVSVEDKDDCRDCQWKNYCSGGCPLEAHRATGRYDRKSPNCAIYQAIFPEVLRLEGLRLLENVANAEAPVS